MYPNQYADTGIQSAYLQNLQDVKTFFRKPIILTAAILYSIQVILNIFNLITGSEQQRDIFNSFYFYYDMPAYNPQTTQIFTVILAVVGSVIPILIAASLWIVYLKSRSANPQASPSAGFTILYVLSLISLIAISLLLVFFIAVCMIMLSMLNMPYWESQVALFIVILVILIVAPLLLLLVIAQFRFAAALRASAKGPVLKPNGSVMFAVLYIIMGAFLVFNVINSLSIIASLSSVYSDYYIYDKGELVLALIGSFLSAAIAILMAIVALSYNGYVKRKKMGYLSQQDAVYYTQGGQAYYNPNMGYPQQSPSGNTQAPYQNQAYYVPLVAQPEQPPYAGNPDPGNQPGGQQMAETTVSQVPVQQAQETPEFASPLNGVETNFQEPISGSRPEDQETQHRACPVCGCEVTEEAAYCPQCGTSLK